MSPKAALPAAVSLVLLAMYFMQGGGDDESSPKKPPVRRSASTDTMEERLARDEEQRQQRLNDRDPGFSDVGEARREKKLDRMMRRYGNSPLEMVGDRGGDQGADGGLEVLGGTADLRSFIESGGRYSGPIPDELAAELYGSDQ